MWRLFLGLAVLLKALASGPYTPSSATSLYPINSLNNNGALFSLGGDIPTHRVHHSIVGTSKYLIVYGGYSTDGSTLGDVNLFYIPSQQWSGPVVRKQCCDAKGENIETIGSDSNPFNVNTQLPWIHVGFQGDAPLPRAEHGACVLQENMFIFGGKTTQYGHMNDMYKFDPVAVHWTTIEASYEFSFPSRRSGHSMVCDPLNNVLYVFGGRGNVGGRSVGHNDIWRYDTIKNTWSRLTRTSNSAPATTPSVRQHASMILLNGNLYIVGGIDPATGLVFSDVWTFHVALRQWELLYTRSTGNQHSRTSATGAANPSADVSYQFAPPPLYNAHIVPIVENLDPFTGINTTFYGRDDDVAHETNGGFLIYGGVGGGGNCGSVRLCGAKQTVLGQVYRFSITEKSWTSPHTVTGSVSNVRRSTYNDMTAEMQRVTASGWDFARISGAGESDYYLQHDESAKNPGTGEPNYHTWADRGKMLKNFAFEKVVFFPSRNLMYEFGGLTAVRVNRTSTPSIPADMRTARDQSSTIQAADITQTDPFVQGVFAGRAAADGTTVKTGRDAMYQDAAGGLLTQTLADKLTGEQLRDRVDILTNGAWHYSDAFVSQDKGASYYSLDSHLHKESPAEPGIEGSIKSRVPDPPAAVVFLRAFRTYTVSPSDIVLIKEDFY